MRNPIKSQSFRLRVSEWKAGHGAIKEGIVQHDSKSVPSRATVQEEGVGKEKLKK